MPTIIERDLGGVRWVRIEDGELGVDVLPDLGGKIVSIRNAAVGREFLWRDQAVPLERPAPGATFDDRFAGGLDELLPNDLPERVAGRDLPDHGELWTAALDARIDGGALIIAGPLPASGLRWRRRLEVEPPDRLRLDWRIENAGDREAVFGWKLHPALRIAPGDRLAVPARSAEVGDPGWSRFRGSFAWPAGRDAAGRPLRADVVPAFVPPSAEFLYLTGLERGEAALVDGRGEWAFRLEFPLAVFPAVQVFASYGGWGGREVLVLEPATAWPISLAEAAARGRASRLAPGEALEATVRVRAGRT